MTRVLFIQFGSYHDAYERLNARGEETYYAQRSSVAAVGALARRVDDVCVLCVNQEAGAAVAGNGVRSLGIPLYAPGRSSAGVAAVIAAADREAPTHVILGLPLTPVLRWAVARRLRILPLLADSFLSRGLRSWYRRRRLIAALNRREIPWIGNHNINASRHLRDLGVAAAKIVPWDWPPVVTPDDCAAKPGLDGCGPVRLIYVGALSEDKGTGDCIRALAVLKRLGRAATLSIVGGGPSAEFEALARAHGVSDAVECLGLVPHHQVLELMRAHDVVLVPSRHSYSEAMPMTIYEAYCSRTPLIASDHPMFRDKVVDGVSGLVFPAADPKALADRIDALARDPDLYARLSTGSKQAWGRLQCPVKHDDFYERWLNDSDDDRRWLADHSLASGRYS